MPDNFVIDKAQVRRAFSRAAVNGHCRPQPAMVVAERLVERLDEVIIQPKVVADIGGGGCPVLANKYADAKMLALDFALPVLRFGGNHNNHNNGESKGGVWRIVADAERLPLADGSICLAYSNLCMEWTDAGVVIAEAARVLRPGGIFVFSTLGPDTLREMRAAFGGRVHPFADMHDIGDMLAPRGFAEPVMQREEIRLTYARAIDAAREIHQWGAAFADAKRQRGMTGKNHWRQCLSSYPCDDDDEGGRYGATFEIIYAVAWRKEKQNHDDGESPVRFLPRNAYNALM